MKENYPLIDLIKSEQPPFWVYNNYAYMYHQYIESYKEYPMYYVMGDCERKPKLDESLQIKCSSNPNLKGIYFIQNESFEWVEQYYYKHFNELESLFIHNWNNSVYTINCFSANHELHIPEYTFSSRDDYGVEENPIPFNEIYKIKVYDFESAGRYPDSQILGLLVKEYLRKISSLSLDSFLSFHFNNCFDAFKFLVHVIEITYDIWKYSANDIECKKIFKKWIKEKIDFLEISNPQVLVDIYCSQKRIEYNESLISNSIPFEVFYNAKFEVKIYAFFQLNEIPTPPQPQQNNFEVAKDKLKVLCNVSTFGYIISELFKKGYIDLPKHNGELSFAESSRLLMQLFDINTTEGSLANSINENKPVLSEIKKGAFSIPDYQDIKPNKK